jgi:phosphonate transport system substrate-binding protein
MKVIKRCLGLLLTGWVMAAPAPDLRPRLALGLSLNVFPQIDIKDAQAAMALCMSEAAGRAGFRSETTVYPSFRELQTDFQKGRIDLAVLTPVEFFQIESSLQGEPAFTASRDGRRTERYVVVAATDKPTAGLAGLKRRRLTYVRWDEPGLLFLNTLLLRANQPEMDRFFGSAEPKERPSEAVHSVFFGAADACVISEQAFQTMVELNPQVGRKLKVIAESPGLVRGMAVYGKAFPKESRDKILAASGRLNEYPRGKQILTLFQVDDFHPILEEDLLETRRLFEEYRRRKGKLL